MRNAEVQNFIEWVMQDEDLRAGDVVKLIAYLTAYYQASNDPEIFEALGTIVNQYISLERYKR